MSFTVLAGESEKVFQKFPVVVGEAVFKVLGVIQVRVL